MGIVSLGAQWQCDISNGSKNKPSTNEQSSLYAGESVSHLENNTMLPEYVNIKYNNKHYPINSVERIEDNSLYKYFNYISKRYPRIHYKKHQMPIHFMPLSFLCPRRFVLAADIAQDSFFLEYRLEDLLKELFDENILSYPSIVAGIVFNMQSPMSYIVHLKDDYCLDLYFATHFRQKETMEANSLKFLTEALDIITPLGHMFDIKAIFHNEPVVFDGRLSLSHLLLSLEYMIEHFPASIPPKPTLVSHEEVKFVRSLVHFVNLHDPCPRKTVIPAGFFSSSQASNPSI